MLAIIKKLAVPNVILRHIMMNYVIDIPTIKNIILNVPNMSVFDTRTKHILNIPNLAYNTLNELGLNPDIFLQEMRKYDGVIAGSFMYKIFSGANFTPGDIDVYIQHFGDNDPNIAEYKEFHLFESFLTKTYDAHNIQKITYSFITGIIYSRVYKTKHININVIFVDQPVITYINNYFDLDCCKIIYDGSNVQIYRINDLIRDITKVNLINKYDLSQLYDINHIFNRRQFTYSMHRTISMIKYKLFYDIYLYNKKLLKSLPEHTYFTNGHPHYDEQYIVASLITSLHFDEFTAFIPIIAKKVDLDKLFSIDPSTIPLTQDGATVISMIQVLERVEKYRRRGITKFEFVD